VSENRRVLIVEDEALITFLLEEMIRDLGYEVAATAGTLDLALAAPPDSFDMAILDVLLGGVEVLPLADRLKEQNKPFAFATGNGSRAMPTQHRDALLLQKPFQQESLKIVLDRMSAS
jgi:DNA-binding NtrC family response regulator